MTQNMKKNVLMLGLLACMMAACQQKPQVGFGYADEEPVTKPREWSKVKYVD